MITPLNPFTYFWRNLGKTLPMAFVIVLPVMLVSSMRRLWLNNASLSIVEDVGVGDARTSRVVLVNDTGHLADNEI